MTNPDDAVPGPQDETPKSDAPNGPSNSSGESGGDTGQPAENATDDVAGDETEQSAGEAPNAESAEDDLPEWEPLTPELVEDEAIRGDFMLRWAVVLLAFLFACSEIHETRVLVHLKTGEWITRNGWLPPATDVFSYTATERSWVNLHWLFDVVLAGVYSVGSSVGLSLLAALLAGATFYVITRISQAEVSTWWGSILATLALIACLPHFLPTPALVTLLGVACTLSILHRSQSPEAGRTLWLAVPLIALWSNLDPRMFVGLGIVIFYAVGDAVGAFLGLTQERAAGWQRRLWLVTGACCLAAMANPFGWHALLAPGAIYGVEDPILRQFFSANPGLQELQHFGLVDTEFWGVLGHHTIAALILLGTTTLTFLLNRDRFDFGWFVVFLGMVVLSFLASRELAAAAVVAAVLGNLNGQQWYRAKFRQTYSVELKELIFSRGGRAVTVLGMFGLAFLAISGRLTGEEGARTGLGFAKGLAADIEGYRQQLADSYDDRPFNFRFDQGDVLIWLGQKVFVDSRVGVYADSPDDELLLTFNKIRRALRRADSGMTPIEAKGIWKESFDRYGVTHVIPRLTSSARSPQPDYLTYQALLQTGQDWQLTDLGPVTAVFYRLDVPDEALLSYLKEHSVNFVEESFRTDSEPLAARSVWPTPPSVYQGWLLPRKAFVPNTVSEAIHRYQTIQLVSGPNAPIPPQFGLGLAIQAVRQANAGLVDQPNSAAAFRLLGDLYRYIGSVEGGILQSTGDWPADFSYSQSTSGRLRYLQAVQSYQQSLVIEPDNTAAHYYLRDLFLQGGRLDLALEETEAFLKLMESSPPVPSTDDESGLQQIREVRDELRTSMDSVRETAEKLLADGTDRLQVAQGALQQGYVLEALRVLEEDPTLVAGNPVARRLKAHCLLEAGRAEEAAGLFAQLQSYQDPTGQLDVRTPAGLNILANGEYGQAIEFWAAEVAADEQRGLAAALSTVPLVSSPPEMVGQPQIAWPIHQILTAQNLLYQLPQQSSSMQWFVSMAQIESGQNTEAAATLKRLLAHDEESVLRPLVRFYLFLLTNELIELEPPSNMIPVSGDMFAEDGK